MGSTRRRGRTARIALVVGLALALAGCATTGPGPRGTISGRVRFADDASGSARGVFVMAWPENAPESATPHRHGFARVDLDDDRFAPATLLVGAGTTVEFRNRDRVFHIPFSRSPSGAFELGRCAPGSSRRATFDHPGEVQVYCALHPREGMTIVVAPEGFRARPAADGTFTIRNVPYGAYLVRAWHPTLGDVTKRVVVAANAPALVSLDH